MALIDTQKLPLRDVKPGWHGRFFDSGSMSFAYYDIEAGASLHEHAHPHEEVWHVLSGEMEITVGAEAFRAVPGTAAIVPPNTAHSVRAITASSVIIVDHPLRENVGGSERAALAVEIVPGANLDAPLSLMIRNRGRAPGTILRIDIESGVAKSLPPSVKTEIPTGELPDRIVLVGGASHAAICDRPVISADERAAVLAGSAVFYLRGVIFYEDHNGERHHSTFCRMFDSARGFVLPPRPGYNYGD